jgi:hypothetical protein
MNNPPEYLKDLARFKSRRVIRVTRNLLLGTSGAGDHVSCSVSRAVADIGSPLTYTVTEPARGSANSV